MPHKQLSARQRYAIEHLHRSGYSLRDIGRRLGRHHTTISREMKRNCVQTGLQIYTSDRAQATCEQRRRVPRHAKRLHHEPLAKYVWAKLKLYWSPEQISGRLKLDFPTAATMRISPEAVYLWVYRDAKQGGTSYKCLRRSHRKRRPRLRLRANWPSQLAKTPLSERPVDGVV